MTYHRKRIDWGWEPWQEAELLRRYPDTNQTAKEIGSIVGKTEKAVRLHAYTLGMKRPNGRPSRKDEIFQTDHDIMGAEEAAEHKRIVDEARKAVIGEQLARAILNQTG